MMAVSSISSAALHVAVGILALLGVMILLRLASGIRREPPRPCPLGLPDAFAAGILGIWFLSIIAQSRGESPPVDSAMIIGSAVIYGGLVALVAGFLAVRRISPALALGLRWTEWQRDLPVVAISFLAVLPVIAVAQWTASQIGASRADNQPLLDFWLSNAALGDRVLVAVMAVAVAPLAEETLFRGYLYNAARRYAGPWWAMLATSLLFAAVHVHLPAFLGLFVLAMALNLIYEKTGSLWAPISAHAAFNAISLLAATAWPDAL